MTSPKLLAIACGLAILPVSAATITTVGPSGYPDSVVSLTLSVDSTMYLYAFQVDLAFNPLLLRLNSVTEGLLPGYGATDFVPGTIDNVAGTVTGVGDSLLGFIPGAQIGPNPQVLLNFHFTPLTAGTTNLDLSNVILLDSDFNDISAGIVNRNALVSTPEPGTFSLFLLAGAVVGGWWKRSRATS